MQRIMMNIITFRLDYALMYEYNSSNFLQPVELLGGQSLCDLMLEHQHDVGDGLSAIHDVTRERLSIMEQFLVKINISDEKREEFYEEDDYLPRQDEISRDPIFSNPL